jgi:hypothetical protein
MNSLPVCFGIFAQIIITLLVLLQCMRVCKGNGKKKDSTKPADGKAKDEKRQPQQPKVHIQPAQLKPGEPDVQPTQFDDPIDHQQKPAEQAKEKASDVAKVDNKAATKAKSKDAKVSCHLLSF